MSYFSEFTYNCKVIKRFITFFSVNANKYEATNIIVDIDEKGDCLIEAHFKDDINFSSTDKIIFLAKIDEEGQFFKGDIQALIDDYWFYLGSSNVTPYSGTPGGFGNILLNIESEDHLFSQNDFLITAFLPVSDLTNKGLVQI